ncbi:MMPL family transporter [Streptacidiphilus rugosus]|uniref:MMPL family transporter n=1 Tax=Streptacidiphilus rugosus TaxID=405783 RepID=UPI00068C508F|nr:MMPL family transporter [Streptacidiphilus rugosus]
MHQKSTRCSGPFAALGRFSFRHRRWVALAWTVLVVLGLLFGTKVFNVAAPSAKAAGSESAVGSALLSQAGTSKDALQALVSGRSPDDAKVRSAVASAEKDLRALPGVASVSDVKAADGSSQVLSVQLGDAKALDRATARLDRIAADSGATVRLGGNQVLQQQVQEQTKSDTEGGEMIALPVTLAVMVLIFGGFVAAGLPLLGAIGSVAGALLALFGFTRIMPMDTSVLPITTVLGLGLSIDYALLMVNRFREERSKGATIEAAVERTSATAGRTIAFSALTVAVALSGLFVLTSPIFRAVAAAGVSVVVITVLSGLTLVPAMLGFAGKRIKPPKRGVRDDGRFAWVVRQVQRKALPVALGAAALLVACAGPFFGAHAQSLGTQVLPSSFSSREVADVIAADYPQLAEPDVTVYVKSDKAVATAYAEKIATLADVRSAQVTETGGSGDSAWSAVGVRVDGTAQGATAQHVVGELRADRAGLETWVTGNAASVVDFRHEIDTRGPWALGLIVVATFILLFLMTGSVVVPVKALVMNLLSLGAALGVMTLVFQDGWFSGLLGFTPTGGLEAWIPVLVFVFSFGLSMDYEVFLLSRIKELHDEGYACSRSVELGVQRSGRIITSAAALMVIVFLGFSTGRMLDIKEIGLALAVAVLVDATLVRMLLVPATMSLFGKGNWWAPAPLRRLYARFGLKEHANLPPLPEAVGALPLQRSQAPESESLPVPAADRRAA